jgi:hypothetical protein
VRVHVAPLGVAVAALRVRRLPLTLGGKAKRTQALTSTSLVIRERGCAALF